MARKTSVSVSGQRLELTNQGKVLYPETGTTKADVLGYYNLIAPLLIEHASWRPATLKRWVNGVGTAADPQSGFFQKNIGTTAPPWVKRFSLEHSDHTNEYPLVNDAATLAWLAQLAALEIHTPQWRFGPRGGRRHPDRLIIDLDPGEGVDLVQCAEVALLVRARLRDQGLEAFPVTSGSKGIHLYAELDGSRSSDTMSELAHELARGIEADHGGLVVSDMAKRLRPGKVLIDWSQNNGSKTTIAPYSLRGRSRPTVAAPRTWSEIASPKLHHLEYTEVMSRILKGRSDPLRAFDEPADAVFGSREGTPSSFVIQSRIPVHPMLAAPLARGGLEGDEWRFEMKWDGIRAVCEVRRGVTSLWSRTGKDMTGSFPELSQELPDALQGKDAVVDGEIIAMDALGRPSFGRLQDRLGVEVSDVPSRAARTPVHLMLFDVLDIQGERTTDRPYRERRALLETLVTETGHVHVPPWYDTDLDTALAISKKNGLEGVVAKRPESPYRSGSRSTSWRKVKHEQVQEVVLIGWVAGAGDGLSSLVVAVPTDGGMLRYAGRVGTGFTDGERRALHEALIPLSRQTAALAGIPREARARVSWAEPSLVGEVRFSEWTRAGRLRHASWRGLRRDKTPSEVLPPEEI